MQNNTNPQVKTEANPQSPPPPQIKESQQQADSFPTHGTILTITKGSNTNFDTKRQCRDYYCHVKHATVEGPTNQTKWSHMPITLSSQGVNLASFPHTDAMVIIVHIDRWDITKILIDNGSNTEILFLAAFDKMGFDHKQLREPSKPLYGFGGKRIESEGVITLLVAFGTPKIPAPNTSPSKLSRCHNPTMLFLGGCHTRFLCQNQVLIACVPKIIYSTHMDQKCS
jgi:hypothetical protein